MPNKSVTGYKEKQFYRNERFTKGTISTNDPIFEGSFRRLINFKISNQNASIENRDPFLSVPLFNLSNREIKISKNAFVFSFNDDTEHAYILDINQTKVIKESGIEFNEVFSLTIDKENIESDDYYVIDGDTIFANGIRYRLAYIDTPEVGDPTYKPIDSVPISNVTNVTNVSNFYSMGEQAKLYTENFLKNKVFKLLQFEFQPEKIDEFGRKIVFVYCDGKLLNIELLRMGLATFYNANKFFTKELTFKIPQIIKINGNSFNLFDTINTAYTQKSTADFLDLKKEYAAYSDIYTDNIIKLDVNTDRTFYTKPILHKIKKETDLKQLENKKIIKRVLETFELNEIEVKKDLEVFNDDNLKYELITKEHSVIYGKYADQYLNFFAQVYNIYGIEIYRGLMEITHTPANYETGVRETFNLRSYKNPEAHIEIQNITNYKPNIADDKSIVPETLIDEKSNVRGYSSPSVNAVLLNVTLNQNLEKPSQRDEVLSTKYFNVNTPVFSEIRNYYLTPFFKAPKLNDTVKNKYMFRWDFINLAEIDTANEEAVKNANPFFRTAWTELVLRPSDAVNNISTNASRIKKINTTLKNFRTADEYYFIKDTAKAATITSEGEIDLETIKHEGATGRTIKEMQDVFNAFINDENNSLDVIKSSLVSGTSANATVFYLGNDGQTFQITKVKDQSQLQDILNINDKDSNIAYDEIYRQEDKPLTRTEREKLFELDPNKNKKIAFIFCPLDLIFENNGEARHIISYAWETTGVLFELQKDRKQVVPYNINFQELYNMTVRTVNPLKLDFDDFFKAGILAVFYLYNYSTIESLIEPDEFYDNLAYRKTSATYFYKYGSVNRYYPEDFIDDKLDKESYAIKYCKYITPFEDMLFIYGNSMYKNTVFMSEPGAPYYFTMGNTFEFDHEVIHVQAFKTIALVFTINDIWVIYRVETRDEFGKITIHWRMKKVLYNISTEVKNKPSIKNITRYITLMSNNVLYLIKPSTYISDDTEFYLNILSQNIDAIVRDPLMFINERLRYHGIFKEAKEFQMNLNATDNYIKLYYSTKISDTVNYTLILTYDILNQRWYEEDTCSFGYPHQIYLLDSTTKYEMLTENNNQLFITYNTDKYKNMMLNSFNESYYDRNYYENFPIKYYIDSGYLKLNEHLKKRFKTLQFNIKNVDSKQILFTYNFTIDDRQYENNFEPVYVTNDSNVLVEVQSIKDLVIDVQSLKQLELELTKSIIKLGDQTILDNLKDKLILNKEIDLTIKDLLISEIGTLNNFLLDFANLEIGDIMTVKQPLLGIGRLPRIQLGFTANNRFYILAFALLYSEHGGK